jgi:hypothetical protein
MKLKLFVFMIPALFVFCSAAHAQIASGVLSNQPMVLELPEHPQHAEPHDMATERPLVGQGSNTYTYAQGERPLWEFGPVSQPVPLGDIARAYRQQKLVARKATVFFEQQGSNVKIR